jgi:hypothetical protein
MLSPFGSAISAAVFNGSALITKFILHMEFGG